MDTLGKAWHLVTSDWAPWLIGGILLVVGGYASNLLVQFVVQPDQAFEGIFGQPAIFLAVITPASFPLTCLCLAPFVIYGGALGVCLQRAGLTNLKGMKVDISKMFTLNGKWFEVACWRLLLVLPWALIVQLAVSLFGWTAIRIDGKLGTDAFDTVPDYNLRFNLTGFEWHGPATAFLVFVLLPVLACLAQARYLLVPLIIVEEGLPIRRAIAASAQRLRGRLPEVAGQSLAASLLAGVGLIACGVGVIFSLPLAFAVAPAIYGQFSSDDSHTPSERKTK